MPCLYLETTNFAQVGAIRAEATFDKSMLESPPAWFLNKLTITGFRGIVENR